MSLSQMHLANVGPMRDARVTFSDLTVLVGPQATGKSIALQFLKLLADAGPIRTRLEEYGVDWEGKLPAFMDAFLGEGMHTTWQSNSTLTADGKPVDLAGLIKKKGPRSQRSLFFIPAQRVLTLRDGWPRPFSDYGPGDPFTVRDFSDELRLLMEGQLGKNETLFPKANRLKNDLRDSLDEAVFHGFGLRVDKLRSQKRLVLGRGNSDAPLPFMVWSAGQREFVPLLLGLYWLLPSAKMTRRPGIDWVVIEELEMGLHPKAISTAMLLVLELLWRGYRVCLSTHSPQVLDVLWALRVLKENGGTPEDVLSLFECKQTAPMREIAKSALTKEAYVHYFRTNGRTLDISRLDPGSADAAEAGWGGLSEFSGKIGDVVSNVVARKHQEAHRCRSRRPPPEGSHAHLSHAGPVAFSRPRYRVGSTWTRGRWVIGR